MSRPLPRKLQVLSRKSLTPNMLRITLAGADLDDFPREQEGGYIKLHFVRPQVLNEDMLEQLQSSDPSQRPLLRTYTISHQRYSPNEIDIDFAAHHAGPAFSWAKECQIGDAMYIAGPGKKKLLDETADWFFIVGDMTSLPAISVNLAALPTTARGYAIIEISSEEDKQSLAIPDGIQLHWIIRQPSDNCAATLLEKVSAMPALPGRASAWLACEFTSMRSVRQYFLEDLAISKRDVYASSYWKLGLAEDEHKVIKRQDNLEAESA